MSLFLGGRLELVTLILYEEPIRYGPSCAHSIGIKNDCCALAFQTKQVTGNRERAREDRKEGRESEREEERGGEREVGRVIYS